MKPFHILLLVVSFLLSGCDYNRFVELDENVEKAWADVQTSYQRRSDLIGNLVETVKGAANFERETLTAVTEARAKASGITIDPSNTSPEQMRSFESAQSGLSQSLGRLLVTVEQYPQLKANQNFLELQTQLEGTENRIAVARNRYNESVAAYNKTIRRFPSFLYASSFGFEKRTPFAASEAAQNAPKVEF
jgi:LemA protein